MRPRSPGHLCPPSSVPPQPAALGYRTSSAWCSPRSGWWRLAAGKRGTSWPTTSRRYPPVARAPIPADSRAWRSRTQPGPRPPPHPPPPTRPRPRRPACATATSAASRQPSGAAALQPQAPRQWAPRQWAPQARASCHEQLPSAQLRNPRRSARRRRTAYRSRCSYLHPLWSSRPFGLTNRMPGDRNASIFRVGLIVHCPTLREPTARMARPLRPFAEKETEHGKHDRDLHELWYAQGPKRGVLRSLRGPRSSERERCTGAPTTTAA